ncbi:hypothetical protein ACFE04_014324 [Oxalis oulophora]
MGKTGKWLKNLLAGKKDHKDQKERNSSNPNGSEIPTTPTAIPQTTPKEKKRWSFRRSSASAPTTPPNKEIVLYSAEPSVSSVSNLENEKHMMAVAAATAAAVDAVAAATQAAATVMRLTAVTDGMSSRIEEDAAVRIQSVFRSYLARKALRALKGLVKLQALVRGHLVRRQATATLRCMQALVSVQTRARAQRIKMVDDGKPPNRRPSTGHRKSTQENRVRHSYDIDRNMEENIKIVEMDHGDSRTSLKSRNSYSVQSLNEPPPPDHRLSAYYPSPNNPYSNQHNNNNYHLSPSPSAITDSSPKAHSNHFEEYSFGCSPQCYSAMSKPDPSRIPFSNFPRSEYAESMLSHDFPNYMANTESSRAKARSQSAPKSRPAESFENQLPNITRRRPSIEGRKIPRGMKMQRSSSHVGATAQNYQFPWALKLDRSTVSLKESECGSTTSTVLTATTYCKSLYDPVGHRY